MIKNAYVLILMILLSGLSKNTAAQNLHNDESYIDVSGLATMDIVPNEIYIIFTLESENNELDLDKIEGEISSKFRQLGLDNPEFKNAHYFNTQNFLTRKEIENREYQIVVSDLETLKKVFKILRESEAITAGITKLSHSNIKEMEAQTRQTAIDQARQKADEMLSYLGQSRGKVKLIRDFDYTARTISGTIIEGGDAIEITDGASLFDLTNRGIKKINYEKIRIQARVQIQFEIKD